MQEKSFDYLSFVEEQIEQFKKASDLIDASKNEVTPMMLNSSLAVYSRVNAMLNAEYQRKKWEALTLKRRFDALWDQWLTQQRVIMYEGKPQSFKIAVSEIESTTRVEHAAEYEALQSEITEVETACEFLLRLMDQWKLHAKILEILSNNMRQEIASLSIENRMNNKELKVVRKEDPPISRRRLQERDQ